MAEINDDRSKKAHENFEKILPRLWEKARENELKLKSEYITTLHTKLLDEIKTQISKPSFHTWFSGLSIEDVSDDYSIVFGTKTTLVKEWLEQRYLSLIEKSLKTITNNDIKVSIVLRSNQNSENKVEELYIVEQCLICESKDLLSKNIEIPFEIQGIVSVTVEGFLCPNCGEEYYSDTIKEVMRLIKRRDIERRITPMHLQSEEYKISSAEAARDDENDN